MEWMRWVSGFPSTRHSKDMVPSPIDGTTLELPRWIWWAEAYGVYVMNSDWFGLKWVLHPELMTHGFNSEMSSLATHAWCPKVVSAMVISTHSTILAIMHTSGSLVVASASIAPAYWSDSSAMTLAVLVPLPCLRSMLPSQPVMLCTPDECAQVFCISSRSALLAT